MALTPTDEDFDDMHHAIGRAKTLTAAYRNYYCIGVESETAKRFIALGWWNLAHTINEGRDGIFTVNMTGITALDNWLKTRTQSEKR